MRRFLAVGTALASLLAFGCGRSEAPTKPSTSLAIAGPVAAPVAGGTTVAWTCVTRGAADHVGIFVSGVAAADCPPGVRPLAVGPSAALSAPGGPANLISSVTGTTVSLTWSAPTSGDPPTSYVIEAGSSPGAANLASFDTGTVATSLTVTGVTVGTYYVRVRARNDVGVGGPSNEITVNVFGGSGACTTAPGAPSGLTRSVNGSSVTLVWGQSSGATSYVLEAGSSPGASDLASFDTGSAATSFTAPSVSPGTYNVRVKAKNACGTSAGSNEVSLTILGGAGSNCATISPTSQAVADTAAAGSVTVTAPASCSWTAGTDDSFITITSGSSGTGNGTVTYSVAPNTTGRTRQGTITIGGQTFTITQQICTYTLSTTTVNAGAEGGVVTIAVTAPSACTWTAKSNIDFIVASSSTPMTGFNSAQFNVQPNPDFARVGTLTVAGQTVTVTQLGTSGFANCVSGIVACMPSAFRDCTSQTFGGNGGSGELNLGAPASCVWVAAPTVPWVAVYPSPTPQNAPSGAGQGHFGYSVAPNPADSQRSGAIVAGGATFSIVQSGCVYSVSPTTVNVAATGGAATVTVTTSCVAPWTATSNASFVTIASGASGTGNGTATFTVAANPDAARIGSLTIAGQTVTVIQASGPSACAGPPGAPSGLGSSVTGSTVTLQWSASTGSVNSYILEAGSSSGLADLANFDTGTPSTSLTASGVAAGTYFVRMKAKNSCGVSAASNEVVVIVR